MAEAGELTPGDGRPSRLRRSGTLGTRRIWAGTAVRHHTADESAETATSRRTAATPDATVRASRSRQGCTTWSRPQSGSGPCRRGWGRSRGIPVRGQLHRGAVPAAARGRDHISSRRMATPADRPGVVEHAGDRRDGNLTRRRPARQQRRVCPRLRVQRLQSPAEERRAVRLSDGEQLRARGRHRVFRPLDSGPSCSGRRARRILIDHPSAMIGR